MDITAMDTYMGKAIEMAMEYGPKLLLAIITLLIGLWVIRLVVKSLNKAMEKAKVEASLQKFLESLTAILLKALLLISVASMVGIEATSFIAILGAAGLAVGLALQGSLANFAGGVLILLFKPFKVGDVIEGQGYTGKVDAIHVFNTIMKTPDNKTIIIPNGALAGGSITNYSTESRRRVDMTFGIGYGDDLLKAKNLLLQMVGADERVIKDPSPQIVVSELADSSVNLTVRAWCDTGDYWSIYFDMQEKVKLEFDKQGISIPYPQQDIHVHQHN